jgi:hypothetical protein
MPHDDDAVNVHLPCEDDLIEPRAEAWSKSLGYRRPPFVRHRGVRGADMSGARSSTDHKLAAVEHRDNPGWT